MPYKNNNNLPDNVRGILPPHAQDIYREAFNHAWDEYRDPAKRYKGGSQEEVAHKVAWAAVKGTYEKADGSWIAKGSRSKAS